MDDIQPDTAIVRPNSELPPNHGPPLDLNYSNDSLPSPSDMAESSAPSSSNPHTNGMELSDSLPTTDDSSTMEIEIGTEAPDEDETGIVLRPSSAPRQVGQNFSFYAGTLM